ncbi:MAG: DMT family transporter [Ruegeria sp.]
MNNVNGILLVIVSMAAFSIEDMFIKKLSVGASTGQIMFALGLICSLIFLTMAAVQRKRVFFAEAWGPLPVIRAAAEGIGALMFITALSLIDLSTVAAVFQAMPLMVTMGAALFLGEQVGWRRWSAIGVGFVGVLMIIRPGMAGFQPETLLVVATVVAIAARDLITRRINANVASSVVAFQAYFALTLVGIVLMVFSTETATPMQMNLAGALAGAVVFGVLGYYTIVQATRVGEASALTPFRYTRLVFSLMIGVLILGESPDPMTLAGATLIIGSGLYAFLRERRLARQAALAAA